MKYVSISSNKTADYHYFLPIVKVIWRHLGWTPIITEVEGVLESQMERMTPPKHLQDHYLYMVSDADMIPLPDFNKFMTYKGDPTIMGWDITGFTQVPMCYVMMSVGKWRELMSKDWRALYDSFDDGMNKWTFDQHLLTTRLKEMGLLGISHLINRNPIPYLGRIDRSRWDIKPKDLIDCHLLRPGHLENYPKIKELLLTYYPQIDWGWLDKYTKDYATT